jgi:organic radical activating enzyme
MSGCNLACSYCDTREARDHGDRFLVVQGDGGTIEVPNAVAPGEVARLAESLWEPGMHSVCITGGEPLLQAEELAELLPGLKERGIPIYLETNGTLHEGLEKIADCLDWIAMDVKLPSSQSGIDLVPEHVRFLASAVRASTNIFFKMVIGRETSEEEVSSACDRLAKGFRGLVLVLQPETAPEGGISIAPEKIAALWRRARSSFSDVRVIPQTHHFLGIK